MYVLGSDQKNEMKILHHSFMASAFFSILSRTQIKMYLYNQWHL